MSNSKNHTNTIPNANTQNIHSNKDNTNVHYSYIKAYAFACNSNSNINNNYNYKGKSAKTTDNDNDFMKTLLPLINTFVTQLMQKIIQNLPVIINSLNLNANGAP